MKKNLFIMLALFCVAIFFMWSMLHEEEKIEIISIISSISTSLLVWVKESIQFSSWRITPFYMFALIAGFTLTNLPKGRRMKMRKSTVDGIWLYAGFGGLITLIIGLIGGARVAVTSNNTAGIVAMVATIIALMLVDDESTDSILGHIGLYQAPGYTGVTAEELNFGLGVVFSTNLLFVSIGFSVGIQQLILIKPLLFGLVLGFLMRSIYWIIPKKNIIFT
jgi:hypothetical protein